MRRTWWILALLPLIPLASFAAGNDAYVYQRMRMIEDIRSHARSVGKNGEISENVTNALKNVPRHQFVPVSLRGRAYSNRPLSIGHDQTISQPYIVALMTELAKVKPGAKVLEIGTGSGYQAAILAELGAEVYTIEIVPELGREAAAVLSRLGYKANTRIGDGYLGWPEAAPFDSIIVTAAPDHVPEPLAQQMKPGGIMVIPIGKPSDVQSLLQITKKADGTFEQREILPVAFVPLTGKR